MKLQACLCRIGLYAIMTSRRYQRLDAKVFFRVFKKKVGLNITFGESSK